MSVLDHKIDFAAIISVTKANPNGDPLNGNRPRQNYDGKGEISDVCLKRKIRNGRSWVNYLKELFLVCKYRKFFRH